MIPVVLPYRSKRILLMILIFWIMKRRRLDRIVVFPQGQRNSLLYFPISHWTLASFNHLTKQRKIMPSDKKVWKFFVKVTIFWITWIPIPFTAVALFEISKLVQGESYVNAKWSWRWSRWPNTVPQVSPRTVGDGNTVEKNRIWHSSSSAPGPPRRSLGVRESPGAWATRLSRPLPRRTPDAPELLPLRR